MNDDQIDDLKQFFSATVSQTEQTLQSELTALISQSEYNVRNKLGGRIDSLRGELGSLREEMNDGFASVSDAIAGIHDTIDDHDKLLTKLEHNAA